MYVSPTNQYFYCENLIKKYITCCTRRIIYIQRARPDCPVIARDVCPFFSFLIITRFPRCPALKRSSIYVHIRRSQPIGAVAISLKRIFYFFFFDFQRVISRRRNEIMCTELIFFGNRDEDGTKLYSGKGGYTVSDGKHSFGTKTCRKYFKRKFFRTENAVWGN